MTEFSALLARKYGPAAAEIEAGLVDRPVTLRVNPLKSTAEEVLSAFKEYEIGRVPWYADALIVYGAKKAEIEETPLYREGKIYLQSLSSMLPPLVLDAQAGESVLDMTAAPGGKTCEIAALTGGKATVTACERDKIRFERLKFNLARQGAGRVTALLADATRLDDCFRFDRILLDAPCSGSGTVTPASPVRIDDAYVHRCVRMQEKLLRKAVKLLKKGGTLVYSTCSIFREENDRLLERVLPQTGARLLPIAGFGDLPRLPSAEGTLAVRPSPLYEGFFVAKITR